MQDPETSLTEAIDLSDVTTPIIIFTKYVPIDVRSLLKYDAKTGYYLEMGTEDGTENGTPLRWFPFAKLEDGTVTAKLNNSSFSYKEELSSGTYYFISEYVLKNVAFREANVNGANQYGSTDTIENHYGLDYNGSTIQQYITGDMLTEYSISDDLIYKAISKRTLAGEAYSYYDEEYNDATTEANVTHDTQNQSLWLLSETEYNYLESTENTVASVYAYGMSTDYPEYWWLRSPDMFIGNVAYAYMAYSYGYATRADGGLVGEAGVRPAFQIDIA